MTDAGIRCVVVSAFVSVSVDSVVVFVLIFHLFIYDYFLGVLDASVS